MKIGNDLDLMNSSLCFLVFLLVKEARFPYEDDIAVFDGFLYTGFAMMQSQHKISQWLEFLVCISCLSIKSFLGFSFKKSLPPEKKTGPAKKYRPEKKSPEKKPQFWQEFTVLSTVNAVRWWLCFSRYIASRHLPSSGP